jgi:homoserine kinase type II
MAVYTRLTPADRVAIARAHGIDGEIALEGVAAGSVNTNYWLRSGPRAWFLRVYEEQDAAGAAWEWRLLERLRALGVPVPERTPGEAITIAEKPVALFEPVGGSQSCQAAVSPARARSVGALLSQVHAGTRAYPEPRPSRFGMDAIKRRLSSIDVAAHPELVPLLARVATTIDEARPALEGDAPSSIIHGDLFRDNVHFAGDEIVAVLDWESASSGPSLFDLAVAMLAWCFGDSLDPSLSRAMAAGYGPLSPAERELFRDFLRLAACRFIVTRVTDYELRPKELGVYKDYRRFVARLDAVEAADAAELLGGSD